MRYIEINWKHNSIEEPYKYILQIDVDDFEIKKMEFYKNGIVKYADLETEKGTFLTPYEFEGLDTYNFISNLEEMQAFEISEENFKTQWLKGLSNAFEK
ncbi:hypothetical protein B0A78_03835 [Flavobacterium columnare NBRC 100251 = ATCC 23463]|uniref:DUF6881 domain-containing protein n=1 Tax=Flavobacterium columnare TaxID=996 RepID=A0AA94F373_9FLAO|nr:hypothetical protein [Flavobacterium columnare]MCH4829568.1 hypothetical protein [Flavobacterium columnare]MCH4831435.1 hypothetical protein [Flavobacterium columnare]PDS25853.1 hypothetical protein B0A78_03835 [Flavobacterium columnare NBRC 100251 = ATCC 23463]GEM59314.1 hypothetical protein FC1_25520 [Flavobacterium columnare NBRC 100251 = ATCC 23463]